MLQAICPAPLRETVPIVPASPIAISGFAGGPSHKILHPLLLTIWFPGLLKNPTLFVEHRPLERRRIFRGPQGSRLDGGHLYRWAAQGRYARRMRAGVSAQLANVLRSGSEATEIHVPHGRRGRVAHSEGGRTGVEHTEKPKVHRDGVVSAD